MRKSHLLIAVGVVMGIFLALQGSALAETLLERGTYLMRSIVACGTCHTPKDVKGDLPGMEMAGGFRIKGPVFNVVIRNITPDKETGIGAWTDKQIIRAIQEGIRADGKIIGPPMPIEFYRDMSDRDVKAIVAYLRQVKPIRNEEEESVWKIPLPKSYGPPVGSVPEVPRTDKIRYGEYLVRIGRCLDCHTPLVKGHRDFKRQLGAGGFPLSGPWGLTFSANITQDKETGIGKWTDRQIKLAITNGQRANGEKMFAPMPFLYYANLKPEDLDAIVAYLRTLKPVRKNGKCGIFRRRNKEALYLMLAGVVLGKSFVDRLRTANSTIQVLNLSLTAKAFIPFSGVASFKSACGLAPIFQVVQPSQRNPGDTILIASRR